MKNKKLNATISNQLSQQDHKALTQLLQGLEPGETTELFSAKLNTLATADEGTPLLDLVKLNSTVRLLDHHTNRPMEFAIVLPNEANIKQRKISVLTPIGIALIGQRKGDPVIWSIGGGKREVTILEVG